MKDSPVRTWYSLIVFILSALALATAWYFADGYFSKKKVSQIMRAQYTDSTTRYSSVPSSSTFNPLAPETAAPSTAGTATPGSIIVGTTPVVIEFARTPESQMRGLSGRASMAPEAGMLFMYTSPARYSFWMKDMRFALDFIWIDETNRVVDIAEDVKPETFPKAYQPSVPVPYVLEVNAGFVKRHGIKIGDSIQNIPL